MAAQFTATNAQQRFSKPEFETGHTQPAVEAPEPRHEALEYLDILLLVIALSLATYFVLKTRSRKSILWLSIFSVLYFGFWREGCVLCWFYSKYCFSVV